MRIIGGQFGGRSLKAPKGLDTRPMLARVREATFNILGPSVQGARCADLFSGTGSLGLEALSRGAEHVDFYESGRAALAVLRANIETLGFAGQATIHRSPLPAGISRGEAWELVFVDPPWGQGHMEGIAAALLRTARLAPGGLLVFEERWGHEGDDPTWTQRGWEVTQRRRYGDAALLMLAPRGGMDR